MIPLPSKSSVKGKAPIAQIANGTLINYGALQNEIIEGAIRDLCRREGIKPGAFYAWTKDFMEAGKERLTRDTARDATRQEIEHIKRENTDLKHLVADLALDGYRLKKTAIPPLEERNGAGA